MYERSYGSQYREVADLSTTDIARLIRADIKAAQKAGDLPTDLRVSVTSEYFSGGSAIRVTVPYRSQFWQTCTGIVPGTEDGYSARSCPNVWCAANNDSPHATEHQVLTVEGQRVAKVVEAIHWAYNYNGSNSMIDYFDVNYYGTVEMQTAESAEWAAREKDRKAQLRADADERKALIADIAGRTWYKPGRLRTVSTEGLRKKVAELDARVAS